jgi:hypothetical protein
MKKLTAIIVSLLGLVAYANAIGVIIIDSSPNIGDGSGPTATTGGLVWLDPGGNLANATLDTSVDINLEVLWGTSANNVNTVLNLDPLGLNSSASPYWLANQPTGMEDITGFAAGALLDPNGNSYIIPGEAPGTTIWLQLIGWTGNSSAPSGPNVGLEGRTTPFSVVVSPNTQVYPTDVSGMGALVLTPEPSLPALFGLAAAAFILLRLRHPLRGMD